MNVLRILIPLDGSELSRTALPAVRTLFDPSRAHLTLLRVGEEPAMPSDAPTPVQVMIDGEARMRDLGMHDEEGEAHVWASQEWESARARLRDDVSEDAERLKEEGWTVHVATGFGDPAREIVAWCEEERPDLVAMATHGRTGLARALLGSVAERAVRRLGVPVLLVRPEAIRRDDAAALLDAGREVSSAP